jgi:protocatechuate 3,4-dioxygenase beta subunit
MRLMLVIPLLLAGCLRAQPGGAAGLVVDQTGKPLAGARVRLLTADFDPDNGSPSVYSATSDSAGQFSVDGLKPGLYLVMAERAGFVQAMSAASPVGMVLLPLKPGQHLTDYKVVLTARALLVGRVVDEYGDPVQGVNIQTEPVPPAQPQGGMFGRRNDMTDDRGEFRIITAPGKYYLKAAVFNQRAGAPEIRTDGTSGAPFTSTYYPSAANTGAASIVQVAAGQDVAGIEIRLLRGGATAAAEHGLTVSGTVTGTPDNARATVMLRFGDNPGQLSNGLTIAAGEDGKFSAPGMRPGYYSAMAVYSSGKTPLQSHTVEFHLEAADETGLVLSLSPGEELAGTLELVGDAPAGAAEKRTVRLAAEGWNNPFGQTEPPAAEVAQDGSFHFANLLPGKFRLEVEPMPENGYLKEVALDGKALTDPVLDFSQGVSGSRLKIAVSRAGGQVSGRVLDKAGEPALGLMMVFLATDAKHLDEDSANHRVTDGKYSFKAVRPGKYRLFALDIAELMQALTGGADNDELMQQFFDAAEEIEIKDADRLSKDVSAWTKLPEKKEGNAPPK